jgi:BirA family transcriptional regulator, biotin operon repressor / biotin---[acetyl-CoA-carboxylase] ligase
MSKMSERAAIPEWREQRFPILASTNDLALSWMRAGRLDAGDVLIADEQSAGRGRRGRTWLSAKGALLLTAVLPFYPERAGWTALAAGVAVGRAVHSLGASPGLKWPNDVLLQGRKLAGVLVETSITGLVAVGVGINVRNTLAEPLREQAIALSEVLPEVSLEEATRAVLVELRDAWDLLANPDPGPLRRAWDLLDATTGRRVRWEERDLHGIAMGIADSGALRLRIHDGQELQAAVGDVSFI